MAGIVLAAFTFHFSPLLAQSLPTNSLEFSPPPLNTATNPVPRDKNWLLRHDEFLKEGRSEKIDLLFLGDSITDFWRTKGSNVWNCFYAPRHAADFGINADRTQHLLWRIQHGELDGLRPRVVVLLIGTNNTGKERNSNKIRNTTEEVIEGVTAVVKAVRARLPGSKILLLGIFPRGETDNPQRRQIREINTAIARLADNRTVVFLDIGDKFLSPDGLLSKDIMSDSLHPTEKGYEIWAGAMEPTLSALFAPQNPPDHGRIYHEAR
jgi:beta-glucosidase